MTGTKHKIKIWFKFPPRPGWPDDTEGLWATPLSGQTAQVESAPFMQEGVAPGDVVRFETDEWGRHWALERVQASGRCVVRVLPDAAGPLGASVEAVNAQFEDFALASWAYSEELPLITFDVPADADFRAIRERLDAGAAGGWWQYEVACADEHWWAA
ncbi:DUF4265 domain-containing protein [Kineosporia sp. J2-2]|uniref:DUF4265 domain-containing protein n=1 Tax=Kineosporia corallincola TaxID=2835133 RepID=A0ABS5TB99_9ACTN|nr:DUF4265 domain-containing protein [Kineosporia corallincola]MBT0768340.1 DUF4265 domain-containing protein [Kineosporia corallincola]